MLPKVVCYKDTDKCWLFVGWLLLLIIIIMLLLFCFYCSKSAVELTVMQGSLSTLARMLQRMYSWRHFCVLPSLSNGSPALALGEPCDCKHH